MELVDKEKVVVEIKRKIEAHKETLKNCDSNISEIVLKSSMSAYQSLLHFLETLEVKEVDLEKDLKGLIGNVGQIDRKIAKHFFELGLKTQKGE